MLPQGLFLAILIGSAISVEEGHSFFDRELWARVGWGTLPEEMFKLKLPHQPSVYCLPFPLEIFCCSFSTFNFIQFLRGLLTGLGFIQLALSAHNLWTKWKHHVRKLKRDLSSAFACDKLKGHLNHSRKQMLSRVVISKTFLTLPICPRTPPPSLESLHGEAHH
ncbi:testis-expressed protein 50-like [Tachyglossus aculeatus]|uniref:testis-expressed protein 50-like n=1 Tax=Tachyglossus aculeatus TaxID=9261 RepID=UPI0018F3D9EF|nr:testis-expressed protein 50-like [Tachyglossus aculeatus]